MTIVDSQFFALVRYTKATEKLINSTLNQYEPLPSNIQFVSNGRYIETQEKLTRGCEYLYLVRLDCDDTYHKSYIQQLVDYQPKRDTCALINQKGYLYDSALHRVAGIEMLSPPFYTWIYRTDEYFKGKRYRILGGHPAVIQFKHEILINNEKRNYLIVVHQRNTLNQNLLNGRQFETNRSEVDAVLKNFI